MTWRGFKTFVGITLIFSMGVLFVSGAMSQDLGTKDRPIYMLLVPFADAGAMQAIGDTITADLYQRTGLYIVVNSLGADTATMIAAFTVSDGDTFGFPTADQYIQIYNYTNGNITPRLGRVLYGYPYYYSSIYARRDSGIKPVDDLAGKVWAYRDTGSTTGYIFPNMLFNNKGIELGRTVETGGHTNSMVALIEGQCDFCTGYGSPPLPPSEGPWASYYWAYGMDPEMWIWDRVTDDLYEEESRGTCKDLRYAVRHTYGLETVLQKIGVVANIGPIPNGCLAFGPDFPTNVADTIVAAIQDQFNDEEMKALWGNENFYEWSSVTPISDSSYDCYRELLGLPIPSGRASGICYYSADNLPTEVSIAKSEKLDRLLVDLLMLLGKPAREYAKEELDLLRELIVLPADAGVDADFYVDVLIGVRESSVSGDDLRALAHNELQLDDIELCRGTEGPPTYNGMSVYTGQIRVISNVPIEEQPLLALAAGSDVLAIDPSFINQTNLDISIYGKSINIAGNPTWTGINSEVLGPGLRGQGVIVGIVDGGIDWDHEGFTNPGAPQTTRLLSLWNQPAAVKRQQAWLNANLAKRRWCTTGDDHGTHVAGIAAGDETATGGRFPGVAPRANIVDVRTTFGDRDIIRGVAYVFGVAAAQRPHKQPAVVNLSLGAHYGPHDGTCSLEVALAGLTGPGCLIVAAAGNEGDKPIHTDNDTAPIGAGKTGNIELNVPAGVRQANIRIWFDPGNNYSSSVKIGKIALASAAPGFRTTSTWNMGGNIVRVIVDNFTTNGISGDRMIEVSLRALRKGQQLPAGKWIVELTRPARAGGVGYYDAWIAYSTRDRVGFVAPTYKELISEPGNSPLIITTGSFDSKSCFRNNRQICDPGRHSTFSSIGPTRETPATVAAGRPGLLKPDISAPGCIIESAENTIGSPFSPYTTMIDTSLAVGTSMAAPHMTGCVALMLQVNPNLTPAQVLALLGPWFVWPNDALYPAALPDNAWGRGKLCCACVDNNGDGLPDLLHVADSDGNGIPDGLEYTRIAFTSERAGNYEIYFMNADGSSQTRLTNNSAGDFTSAWSPDGKHIAFVSDRDGNYEIYVMNANGSSQTRLTNNSAGDFTSAWSPDGKRIAFVSDRDGNNEIYFMNADGSSQKRLTNNTADDFTSAWSPDGKRIAFVSDRDGNKEIYFMNADGSSQTRLTNNSAGDWWPTWSPDGKRIAFVSDRDGNYEIYVMNADGSNQTRLTNNSAGDWYPAWSPQ